MQSKKACSSVAFYDTMELLLQVRADAIGLCVCAMATQARRGVKAAIKRNRYRYLPVGERAAEYIHIYVYIYIHKYMIWLCVAVARSCACVRWLSSGAGASHRRGQLVRRDWGLTPATSAPGLGAHPATFAPGLGAHPCHICTWTGLDAAASAPGLGSPLPTSAPGLGWTPCDICTGTGLRRLS